MPNVIDYDLPLGIVITITIMITQFSKVIFGLLLQPFENQWVCIV